MTPLEQVSRAIVETRHKQTLTSCEYRGLKPKDKKEWDVVAKAAITALIDCDWPVKRDGETAETHAGVWRHRLEVKIMLQELLQEESTND